MMEHESSASPAPAATPQPAAAGPEPSAAPRLFVVHAPEDAWFVEGFLLEALALPAASVVVVSAPDPAAPLIEPIERGVRASMTVVVVSPAFLASTWAQFAAQIAAYEIIAAADDGRATLIPAVLADCELPLQLRIRVGLDFREQERAQWDAQAARLRAALAAPPPVVEQLPCPYPGIRPFAADDAAQFYGRDQEVADLLGRLRAGQRELYVIGPSGSGKSSLVFAGLVPSVRQKPELAGGAFVDRQLRPGTDPVAALAGALDATPGERDDATLGWLGDAIGRLLAGAPDHRLLVIVDQLEELFTVADAGARAAFVAAVRGLRGDARVALVLTLRADFYAQLMESALWTDLDGRLSRLDVGPLRGDQLRTAIEAPARALGVYFEPVLVEQLLHDVADEPGALPLLQDTLVELWERRTQRLLRLAEYQAMSDGARTGLAVTVARRADAALAELSPGRREIARRILLRLVQFGDGAAAARRQQTRAALATAGDAPAEIDAVVHHLADRRLVTTSGGDAADRSARVDLAHEILLSAWPALAEWIRTRRQDEQRRRALEDRAAEWAAHGRGGSRLLDADELHEVRGWLTDDKARDLGVSEEIQSLVARSQAALDAERAELEARRRRRRRSLAAVIAGLTVAVVTVSTLAVIARRRSREASEQAAVADAHSKEARRQAAEARRQLARNYVALGQARLLDNQPAQAAPYLLAAREAGLDDVPLRALFRWAALGVPAVRLEQLGRFVALAWSPDGTRLVTAGGGLHGTDYGAQIWDPSTGRPVTPPLRHSGSLTAVAWSPDGKRVATGANDYKAQVWDAATGRPVTPPLVHHRSVTQVAWSPDGTHLATVSGETAQVWDAVTGHATATITHTLAVTTVVWSPDGTRVATGSYDDTARISDPSTGQATVLANNVTVTVVAWSPDGKRLATAGYGPNARVWDVATGHEVTPPLAHRSSISAVVWSPDGTHLATASADGTARVWDAATGAAVTPPLAHRKSVTVVAWSPDGARVMTASSDFTAQVWDAATGRAVAPALAHRDTVFAAAWSRDGTRVATASRDGTARIWEAETGQPVTPALAHRSSPRDLAWSPDGTHLATGDYDYAVVWDAHARPAALLAHDNKVTAVVWSPDGARVATASDDATAVIWDARTAAAMKPALAHDKKVTAVAWSPDGARVATASEDGTARVWNARTGAAVTPPLAHDNKVTAVAWSPDGARVATASDDGKARIWNASTGEALTSIEHSEKVLALAWSPDGRRLATTCLYIALVWDAATGDEVAPAIEHQDVAFSLAWSPDGVRLATGTRDGTVQIWDAQTGRAATPPLLHTSTVVGLAWSPDGTRLATASWDNSARVWDARTGRAVTPALVHDDVVQAVAWSPDGTRVATASQDGTARVWDASSGQLVAPPLTHEDTVQAVAWSPDGKHLATAADDGTARIWDVSWDTGTLADWRAVVERDHYHLNDDGVLILRGPEAAAAPSAPAAAAASSRAATAPSPSPAASSPPPAAAPPPSPAAATPPSDAARR